MRVPKWKRYFLEVALRAIRKSHWEHQALSIGHEGDDPSIVNMGPGIELAFETAVVSSIAQEFMLSRLCSGWEQDEGRSWVIQQEVAYKHDSHCHADLLVQRQPIRDFKSVYIEAKRARRWVRDLRTGKAKSTAPPRAELDEAADRIRSELGILGRNQAFGSILVWGVSEDGEKPQDFIARGARKPLVRWLPLAWKCDSKKTGSPGEVTRWLWIALYEVDVNGGRARR